mgnify:CR=1|tara:strand:- start:209 stop:505 length:297 start_codon:yes stop_codon:yes gene_type:complete
MASAEQIAERGGKYTHRMQDGERVDLTDAQIEDMVDAEIAHEEFLAANSYNQKRRRSYASIGDQLDQLYWDIDAGKLDKTGEWYKAIKAVKDANAKPD